MAKPQTLLALGTLLLAVSPALAQQRLSPAQLLPENTALYVEVSKPGPLTQQLRTLFKGSVLDNLPTSLRQLRKKYDVPYYVLNELTTNSLLLSPEATRELQRTGGGAVALTGTMTPEGPEYVVLLSPGDSVYPSFFFRTVAMGYSTRSIKTVESVHIYRQINRDYQYEKTKPDFPGKQEPEPPRYTERAYGPAYAMIADMVLVGSPTALEQSIRTAKGKTKARTLADNVHFQTLRKRLAGDGLFVFSGLSSRDDFAKLFGSPGPIDPVLETILNPRTFHGWGANVNLKNGTLHYRQLGLLNAKAKNPLAELTSTEPFPIELLHFVPEDAILGGGLSIRADAKRWQQFLALVDRNYTVGLPGNAKFSDHLKKMERLLQVDLAKDVVGHIRNVAFAVGNPLTAPVERLETTGPGYRNVTVRTRVPMVLVLQTTDAATAQKLVQQIPQWYGRAAGKKVEPMIKTLKREKVHVLQVGAFDTIAYNATGDTVVIGPYADGVAQALADGSNNWGAFDDDKLKARLQKLPKTNAVFLMRPAMTVAGLATPVFRINSSSKSKSTVPDASPEEFKKHFDDDVIPECQPEPVKRQTKRTLVKEDRRMWELKENLSEMLREEQWLVLHARYEKGVLHIEGETPGLTRTVPRVTDLVVEEMFRGYTGHKEFHK